MRTRCAVVLSKGSVGQGGMLHLAEKMGASERHEISVLRRDLERAGQALVIQKALTREADHRLKNSLQILSASLGRRIREHQDAEVRAQLESVLVQIHAVAAAHDVLQTGADETDLRDVLSRLCETARVLGAGRVRVALEAPSLRAPRRWAQPVALTVNELLLNAMRHGFPNGCGGAIRVVAACTGGVLTIQIADDGVGLPPGFNPASSAGFGMKMALAMMATVRGALTARPGAGGTHFVLTVPLPSAE